MKSFVMYKGNLRVEVITQNKNGRPSFFQGEIIEKTVCARTILTEVTEWKPIERDEKGSYVSFETTKGVMKFYLQDMQPIYKNLFNHG